MNESRSFIEREDANFTQVSNYHINDERFFAGGINELRAFALLVKMYSKPPGWTFYRKNLAQELSVSVNTLDKATKVLKEFGYLKVIPMTTYVDKNQLIQRIDYKWVLKAKADDLGVASKSEARVAPQSEARVASPDDEDSKTYYRNTYYSNNNTPSGVSLGSKDKRKNPAKENKEESIGLIYKLARQEGLDEPELPEARGAAIILHDVITPYLGKKAIPTLIQGFREARENIEQGADKDFLTVYDVASQLGDRLQGLS